MGYSAACLSTPFRRSFCESLWLELHLGEHYSGCSYDLQASLWGPKDKHEDLREGMRFGVGIEGGAFTKDGARKALELSLLSKQGKDMRAKIRDLKKNAYGAVRSDGSATENFNTLIDIVTN